MNYTSRFLTFTLIGALVAAQACKFKRTSDDTDDTDDGDTGGDETLVVTDLTGNWRNLSGTGNSTSCVNLSSGSQNYDGGARSYYDDITFGTVAGDDHFNYSRVYYDVADCRYASGNTVMDSSVSGTFAIGALQSGSTFAVTFITSGAEVRAYTTTMANWLNSTGCIPGPDFTTDTNGSPPYSSLDTTGVACTFLDQPALNEVISNVISKSSDSVVKMGAFSNLSAGPGMLSGETASTTVLSTPTFAKQ